MRRSQACVSSQNPLPAPLRWFLSLTLFLVLMLSSQALAGPQGTPPGASGTHCVQVSPPWLAASRVLAAWGSPPPHSCLQVHCGHCGSRLTLCPSLRGSPTLPLAQCLKPLFRVYFPQCLAAYSGGVAHVPCNPILAGSRYPGWRILTDLTGLDSERWRRPGAHVTLTRNELPSQHSRASSSLLFTRTALGACLVETLRVLRWLCPLSFCSHCPRCYRDPELQVVWRIWANSPGTGASLSLRWLAGWLCLSWKMSAMGHRPCPRWIGLSFTRLSPGLQKTVPHTHTHAPNSDLLHAPPVTPRAHPWGGPPPRSLLPRAAAHPPRVAQPHFPLGIPLSLAG